MKQGSVDRLARLRLLAITFWVLLAGTSGAAYAADVQINTPPGGNFVVKDNTGTNTLLNVQGSGPVTVPNLATAPGTFATPVCFGAGGVLGQCASAGGLSQYAYVYNLSAQVVAIEASVAFDSNGAISSGIIHTPGNAGITVANAGIYEIAFALSGVEPSQFALFVNGAPAAGSVFGSGAGTQQNNGQVILALNAADTVTLVNHSSAAAVTLQTLAGGTQTNVNASVLILKLN